MSTRFILADDPGLATGLCLFSLEEGQEPVLLWSMEVQPESYAAPIREAFTEYPSLEVAVEKFTITVQTAKNSQAPYSLEQIGILKQIMRDFGHDPATLTFQTPADAKSLFPNPKLQKLGYWHRGGEGHANDSIRHALLYMAKTGWKPTRLIS